jgi:hypothetical protein
MNSQIKEAADYKLNIFWREVVLSDDAPVTQHLPTPEQIRRRAYEIHLSRGGSEGHDLGDWLQAERELTQANGGTSSALM